MDLFKENRAVFYLWASMHARDYEGVTVKQKNQETLIFMYEDRSATLIMHENGMHEEWVNDRYGDMHFYLHYEFKHYPLAVSFYRAMMKELTKKSAKHKERVLLCCSGGMTISYFKMQMNNYLALSHAPYTIDAAALCDVPAIAHRYDLILVAPQIRYATDKLKETIKDVPIDIIPTDIFATYDCAKLYERIQDLYNKDK